jgi:hypothetical protein
MSTITESPRRIAALAQPTGGRPARWMPLAASAASSAAGQLGSSIGTALLNTIAATATAAYLTGRHAAGAHVVAAATVHGYVVAVGWGAGIVLAAALPIAWLINAGAPQRGTRSQTAIAQTKLAGAVR